MTVRFILTDLQLHEQDWILKKFIREGNLLRAQGNA